MNVYGSRKAERSSRREASKCVCGCGSRRNCPVSALNAGRRCHGRSTLDCGRAPSGRWDARRKSAEVGFYIGFRMPAHGLANRALRAGVRKPIRQEIAGSGHYGSCNLSNGYGDLNTAPVAASAQQCGARRHFGLCERGLPQVQRRKHWLAVRMEALRGDIGLPAATSGRAPWRPGQAHRQSRSILRFGNGDNGVMTCRSKRVLYLAAGAGAWSRGRKPR
jgi:hypothetical protein